MSDERMPRPAEHNAPAFAHVGITVPSLDGAVAWYRGVLGLDLIAGPTDIRMGEGHSGAMAADVFGPSFGAMRVAHLAASNGVAVELFEFARRPTDPMREHYRHERTGIFHICVVERDVDALVERVRRCGGRQRTAIWLVRPGEPYRMCYCEDPFGTIIEIYSHSHEQTYASERGHTIRVRAVR